MTGKRPIIKGSFGGQLDELVKHFPHDGQTSRPHNKGELQDKRDIHAKLFERAWLMDGSDER